MIERVALHLSTKHVLGDPRIWHRELMSLRPLEMTLHLGMYGAPNTRIAGVVCHSLGPIRRVTRHGQIQRYRPSLWKRLQAAWRLSRFIRPHVIHIHDPELLLLVPFWRLVCVRVIYDRHEDYPQRKGLRWFAPVERWLAHAATAVLIVDEQWRTRLSHPRVYYVPNGALSPHEIVPGPGLQTLAAVNRNDVPCKATETPGTFTLVYAGTQGRDRGLFDMLEVVRMARENGRAWRLILAGIGHVPEELDEADALIASSGISQAVERLGWREFLPYEALIASLARADVGLAMLHPEPRYTVARPTKFGEYAAAGLPMVCSDFPRYRDYVSDFDCGLLAAPAKASALYSVIARFEDDPILRREKSEGAGRAAVHQRWTAHAQPLLNAYRDLMPASL